MMFFNFFFTCAIISFLSFVFQVLPSFYLRPTFILQVPHSFYSIQHVLLRFDIHFLLSVFVFFVFQKSG